MKNKHSKIAGSKKKTDAQVVFDSFVNPKVLPINAPDFYAAFTNLPECLQLIRAMRRRRRDGYPPAHPAVGCFSEYVDLEHAGRALLDKWPDYAPAVRAVRKAKGII